MKSKAVLSQTEVATILAAARAEAQANGWAVTIVVADDGGHPLALERLDGCAPIASYIATEKARSSALGRRETKGYEDMVNWRPQRLPLRAGGLLAGRRRAGSG